MPQNEFPWTGADAPTWDDIRDKPTTFAPVAAGPAVVGGVLEAAHQANSAAVVPAPAPAGGVGDAAGGWDTAGNRDAAIATINALVTAVGTLQTNLNAVLSKLQAAGIMSAT